MTEQIILITGACGGIGKALTQYWDQDKNKHLLLLDQDNSALEALDQSLRGNHTLVPFDLWGANPKQYQTLAQMIDEDYGRLDGLIHLAGYCGNLRPLMQCEPEMWLKGLHINLTAPFWLTQQCMGLLRLGHHPHVVFTLHEQHKQQEAYWHSFGTAQIALEHLIRTLYSERAAYPEVAFSCVDPGWVDTVMSRNIFPAGESHWRKAEEIVQLYDRALLTSPEQLETITI